MTFRRYRRWQYRDTVSSEVFLSFQRFLERYYSLQNQDPSLDEEAVFQAAAESLNAEGIALVWQKEETEDVSARPVGSRRVQHFHRNTFFCLLAGKGGSEEIVARSVSRSSSGKVGFGKVGFEKADGFALNENCHLFLSCNLSSYFVRSSRVFGK